MRAFATESRPGTENLKIYGDIKYHNVWLSSRQRGKIESELVDWVIRHRESAGPNDEIQCWVTFKRVETDKAVTCQVQVVGAGQLWESLDFSKKPVRAFMHCLEELNPAWVS